MRDDFAALILSHGRAENVITVDTLRKHGYTGRIVIVIDNEDEQGEEYRRRYEEVVTFDKKSMAEQCDEGDVGTDRRAVLYARNAAFDVAKDLGLRYFVELDDDYKEFSHRYEDEGKLKTVKISNLDIVFEAMIKFLEDSDALTVALAQGGDFIGGKDNGRFRAGLMRKCMNTFFCRTERRFWFVGRMNDDMNTCVTLGMRGELFLSVTQAMIVPCQTQTNAGGMSEFYKETGTYAKSFYTVTMAPSCVKVGVLNSSWKRIHHMVRWDDAVPKIVGEEWRK